MAIVPSHTFPFALLAKSALFAVTLLRASTLLLAAAPERDAQAHGPKPNPEKAQKVCHCSAGFERRKAEYYPEVGS